MIKRPLVVFICSFVLGICAVIYDVNIFVAIAAMTFLLLPFLFLRKAGILKAVIIVLFFASGVLRMNVAQKNAAELGVLYNSQKMNTDILITDFSDGKNAVGEFNDKGKTIKVYLTFENTQKLYPGDIIRGEFLLRTPFESKITKSDFSSYLKSRGIYLLAYADNAFVADSSLKRHKVTVFAVRRYIDSLAKSCFSGDSRSLFNAMVLGDKSKMSDSLTQKLQGAGLNHIAVVSGMHLSVILAVQMFIINRIFGKRKMGLVLAILGAIFITLVTGCGASVIRACMMCVIYQLAGIFYRERDSFTSLAVAAGIMCIHNPYVLFNVGFILSVLSVLGIVLYNEKINKLLMCFLPAKISSAASLCISAQLMVTPAVMLYFNIFTPYALLGNILIFAFVSIYVVCGISFCVLAYVPILGAVLKYIVEISGNVIEYVCTLVSGLDNAIITTKRPDAAFLLLWGFILLIIYLYPKKKNMLMPFALVFTLLTVTVSAAYKTDDRISFLSVTYGGKSTTAALLPQDTLMLIDCVDKWDTEEILSYFEKDFVDYVIVTEKSEEQLRDIIKSGYVKNVILPSELYREDEKAQIFKEFKTDNVKIQFLKNKEYIFLDKAFIEYFSIEQTGNEKRAVKIEYKEKSFVSLQGLSSKEIQKMIDENIKIPCDILKIPFTILNEKTTLDDLTDGKIIQREKEFILNN